MIDQQRAHAMVRQITARCRAEGRLALTEIETYAILQAWGVPVAPFHLAATPEEAGEASRAMGRVVVKIVSPDILHKTDAGCVRLGLSSPEAVAIAAAEVLANARRFRQDARIDGILVQQMAPSGVEIICGGLDDSSFGPVIMAGLGGIFTEVMKDVAFRLAPVTVDQAAEMLRGLKGFPLLTGVRGRGPVDLGALAQTVASLSALLAGWPELKELDLNPLIAHAQGVVAVDGLATLKG